MAVEQVFKKMDTSMNQLVIIVYAAVAMRKAAGFMTAHAMALRPTQRDVALAWVTWLVMMQQTQRLVTIAVSVISLAMD